MSLSSLGFGVLLILQAALAQSAPYLSSYSDEEAILDKLASIAQAARGGNAFDLQFPSSSLDYSDVLSVGNLAKTPPAGLENLGPRQFAYKPDDIRFYFPTAAQFPQNNNNINNNNNNRYEDEQDRERDSPEDLFSQFSPQEIVEGLRKQQLQQQQQQQQEEQQPEQHQNQHQKLTEQQQNDLHYMKKSQPETIKYGGGSFITLNERSDNPPSADTETPKNQGSLYQRDPEFHSNIMASQQSHNPNIISSPLGNSNSDTWSISSFYYIAIIAGCTAAIVVGVVAAGICWYRIHERVKAAADVDYPAYGVTGPSKDVSPSGGDRKLAQSAHFYNYQHQKQQMQALAKNSGDRQGGGSEGCSDAESEASDNEDGDYTVYECPGLAGLGATGEMEVKNPLYDDEPTPATPHVGVSSPNVEADTQQSPTKK